jgi:GNAT superfamily N-acetyltransferase
MAIEVKPATVDRFEDLAAILAPRGPDAPACWCLGCWASSGEANRLLGRHRRAFMRGLCERGQVPGVIAYVDGVPAGWCAVGPREAMGRMARSRTIPRIDDQPVWSIGCFVVRVGYRRQGVMRSLLRGAVEWAESQGATVIEGYPIDPEGTRINTSFAYVGLVPVFEDEGFERIVETQARSAGRVRWLMRRSLEPSAQP